MTKFRFVISMLAALALLLGNSNVALGQATRTWVSGVGDDANPCSRTAPCKTFAGAISKTAAGGEINVLDPGGFGAVTITKAITIDGSGGSIAGVLVSGTNGIVVSAGATDVVILRNLDIDGLNTGLAGIRFNTGGALIIENCKIFEFTSPGIDFEPSATSQLMVNNTILVNNSGGGILVKPGTVATATVTLNNVIAVKNNFGVRVNDGATVNVLNSIASDNTGDGFDAITSSRAAVMNIESSLSVNNLGLAASSGVKSVGAFSTIRISNMSIYNNVFGLGAGSGGSILSFGNNKNFGNGTNGAPTGTIPLQ